MENDFIKIEPDEFNELTYEVTVSVSEEDKYGVCDCWLCSTTM